MVFGLPRAFLGQMPARKAYLIIPHVLGKKSLTLFLKHALMRGIS
jgi:hypothetical protein